MSAAVLLAGAPAWVSAQTDAAPPPAVRETAPGLQGAGAGRLTWFGLKVYDARLWVEPGFRAGQPAQHRFALELSYLRAFSAADIAKRSITEMERGTPMAAADAQRWATQLRRVLSDVQPGDRITGVHLPGQGAAFFFNGKPTGRIDDPVFAERFFGIWLASTTSEPRLRDALLAGTAP